VLSTNDPTCKDQEQELPWLQKGFHISPNALGKNAASGISWTLSSVRKMTRAAFGKNCNFNYLQFG
jgi:hypothetical protein